MLEFKINGKQIDPYMQIVLQGVFYREDLTEWVSCDIDEEDTFVNAVEPSKAYTNAVKQCEKDGLILRDKNNRLQLTDKFYTVTGITYEEHMFERLKDILEHDYAVIHKYDMYNDIIGFANAQLEYHYVFDLYSKSSFNILYCTHTKTLQNLSIARIPKTKGIDDTVAIVYHYIAYTSILHRKD